MNYWQKWYVYVLNKYELMTEMLSMCSNYEFSPQKWVFIYINYALVNRNRYLCTCRVLWTAITGRYPWIVRILNLQSGSKSLQFCLSMRSIINFHFKFFFIIEIPTFSFRFFKKQFGFKCQKNTWMFVAFFLMCLQIYNTNMLRETETDIFIQMH
jgi:hypothetical protein